MFSLPTLPFLVRKDDKVSQADFEYARKLQAEEYSRYTRLRSQFDQERTAETHGVFAKKQRVEYFNQSTATCHPAIILDVHLDDGPHRPYYTIKYLKPLRYINDHGIEMETICEVEKQTERTQLTRVVWDDDAAWEALHNHVI